jgi:HAD superfamily hydrolase (TIGR01509 family)
MTNLAIIFDLDGVLIDSKEIHFQSLNKALSDVNPKYVIARSEQKNTFEGLTTKSKLEILTITKGLPKTFHELIWKQKQIYSLEYFKKVKLDEELVKIFEFIKSKNIKIGVASNAIRETLDICLLSLGIHKYVDFSLSNEDVTMPKPNPEIYLSMMNVLGADQKTTFIFEDSAVGREAARSSGAFLIPVESRKDLNIKLIKKAIEQFEKEN